MAVIMHYKELQRAGKKEGCQNEVSLFVHNMHFVVFFYARELERLAEAPCAKNKLDCRIFTAHLDLVMMQQYLPQLSFSCFLKAPQDGKLLKIKEAVLFCAACDPRLRVCPVVI